MLPISIHNFSKNFHGLQVIKSLSFDLQQGEIMAFLGANGAGKTTTIRALLGIYAADTGKLTMFGEQYTPALAHKLGYLPEERGIYLDAPVLETIVYFGELKGVSKQDATTRASEYLERVGLSDKAKVKIKKLSSGQQQKIQLGITLINRPQLLILDEPTKGLDPVNRQLFMDIFAELNKSEGTSILFSTHQMDEAERIANRLVMIHKGERVLYGPVAEVKQQFGNNTAVLRYQGQLPQTSQLFSVGHQAANYAELRLNSAEQTNNVITELIAAGVKINSFELTTPSLQEIFIQVSQS
jgi:ABC-2 type transport system ATP-binding protein